MVDHKYRWDFIGLSTDSKPTASSPRVVNGSTYYEADTSKAYVWYKDQWYEKEAGGSELPIASAETLGGVKVGEGLSITEAGVLSASGGGGSGTGMIELTSSDYNYPVSNPNGVAGWLLPNGTYYFNSRILVYGGGGVDASNYGITGTSGQINVYTTYYPGDESNPIKIIKFEVCDGGDFYMGITKCYVNAPSTASMKFYADPE